MKRNTGLVTFLNNPITLLGDLTVVGEKAPDFTAVKTDLTPFKLFDYSGKVCVISSVPSIDTGVCDLQTRRFNQEAANLPQVQFISISCDLPFALKRYCGTADIKSIETVSDHKDTDFGLKYGFLIEELRILNRGIIIIDKTGTVVYVEYVKENTQHPDYDKALEKLKTLL